MITKAAFLCILIIACTAFKLKKENNLIDVQQPQIQENTISQSQIRTGSAITSIIKNDIMKTIEYSAVFFGTDAGSAAAFISKRLKNLYPGMWNVVISRNSTSVQTILDTNAGSNVFSDNNRWWFTCGNCNKFASAWSYFLGKTNTTDIKCGNFST